MELYVLKYFVLEIQGDKVSFFILRFYLCSFFENQLVMNTRESNEIKYNIDGVKAE